jgi:hypothetical protein
MSRRPTPPTPLDRNLGWLDDIVGARERRRADAIARLPPLLPDSPMDRMLRHLASRAQPYATT